MIIDDHRKATEPTEISLVLNKRLNWCDKCYERRFVVRAGQVRKCSCVLKVGSRAYRANGGRDETFFVELVELGCKEVDQ